MTRGTLLRTGQLLAVGAVIASIAPAAAEAPPAAPTLKLKVQPKHLVLGRDKKATVRVTVPADGEAPVVETSLGNIENLRKLGPRLYAVDLLPPKPTYPQVAIISATSTSPAGVARAWKALPLWGSGDAVVKTEPNTPVTVTIGKRRFGPVRANAEGMALVPIVVPPGVQVGIAEGREIDLGVPATKLLIVSLDRQRVRADLEQHVAARIFVVDEAGEPRTDVSVDLSASRGEVAAATSVSGGEFITSWTLPPGPAVTEKLIGKIPGEEASTSIAKLIREPGPAASVRLELDPALAIAGETAEVIATATVVDASGNKTAGAVSWQATPGAPTAVEEGEAGTVRARFAVPTTLGELRQWEIEARLTEPPAAVAKAQLQLNGGTPAELRFDESVAAPSDDNDRDLRLWVRDRHGNLVEGVELKTEAQVGEIEGVRTDPEGAYLLEYSAPWGNDATSTRVDVAAGEASASTVIALRPGHRYTHVGLKLGGLSDVSRNHTLFIAGELAGWLPLRDDAFGLNLELGYFFLNQEYPVDSGPLAGSNISARNNFVTIVPSLAWRRTLFDFAYLWVQAGLGAAIVSSTLTIPDQPATSESSTVPIGAFSLGAGWKLWMGGPFVEGRYTFLTDPELENLRGALPAAVLAAGYRFELL